MTITRRITFLLLCLLSALTLKAQLYSKAYGDKKDPAIIFLHGGPGYNSFSFEASSADRLVEEGYYVIVFDQRGSGRSGNIEGSKYDFEEAIADLNSIYAKYGVEKAALIGHSWGGTVGVVFAEKNAEKVDALILVGAPMDYQQTFKAIIANSDSVYESKGNDQSLKYINMIKQMDTSALAYANYCFMHAMASGQYTPDTVSEEAKTIKAKMVKQPDAKQLRNMTQAPVKGFYNTEHYTTLKLYDRLRTISKGTPVFGIYGIDDGLFDDKQLNEIRSVVGKDNFSIIKNASHNVFIDQQNVFVDLLNRYLKK